MEYSDEIRIITKIEAVERLLQTAVDLFFEDRDILAIHALSSSAHEVLHVLLKTQGKRVSLMKDNPSIRPEKARQYYDMLHETQNFLKHASKDRNATLNYGRTEGEMWLFDTIQMYGQLTGSLKFKRFGLYSIWFHIRYPEILREHVLEQYPTIKSIDHYAIKKDYKRFLQIIPWGPDYSHL